MHARCRDGRRGGSARRSIAHWTDDDGEAMMALLMLLAVGGTAEAAGVLQIAEWDVLGPFPVGKTEVDGDVLEAHGGLRAVRMEEMRQSVRIVRQAIKKMPGGAFFAEDAKKIYAPRKDKILTSMEELIQNFMITTEGPDMPAGEVYFEAENPKGALGFYIVSKGGGVPYRMKIRGPSFNNLSILEKVSVGAMISDISAILGSLDFVMGECDR